MWVYESKNSAIFLSLHDCECSKLRINKHTVILCMDWMEVMPEHPNNPYSVAHQSGEGQVEFIGCRNVNIRVEGQDIDIDSNSVDMIFQSYEVLDFEITQLEDYFCAKIYMVQNGPFKDISISLIYDSDVTRLNEFGDESRFVDFYQNM